MAERPLTPGEIQALGEFLRRVPLFGDLRPAEIDALVAIVHYDVYRAGTVLYHQSDADGSAYLIYDGEVALAHIDPQGAPHEVGVKGSGDLLGESSLLLGEPHDVTVKAATDASVLVFSREEFKTVCDQQPGLMGRLKPKDENWRKLNAPHFGWQSSDEAVVIFVREHIWSWLRAMIIPSGLLVVAVAGAILISQISPLLAILFSIIAGLLLLGLILYVVVDWRNDFYVVTNKRLVHVDEIPLFRKRREEAPLSAVTEIQFARHSILAHLMDFGDLRVETFSGAVGMKDIPHPDQVKNLIQREIERVRARARAAERIAIRKELERRIIAQEAGPAEDESLPLAAAPRPSSRAILTGVLRYFFPPLREVQGDAIIWRKHWVVLWRITAVPFLVVLGVVWAIVNWWNRWFPFGLLPDEIWWLWPIIFGIVFAWWLWLFEDWRNDQYIITSTRIIDIERTPFLMSERRKEATLARIQTTEIKVPTPTARFLRYGNLTIRVPGAAFEFNNIKDPAAAQAEVNKRMADFNKRIAENEARGRRTELSDWFAAYDQVRQSPAPQRASPPPQVVGDGGE
jgi:hypothetical protein